MSDQSKVTQDEMDKLDEDYRHYRNQIIQLTGTIIILSSIILGWFISSSNKMSPSNHPTCILAIILLGIALIIFATSIGMVSQYLVFRGYFESAQLKFKKLMERHYPSGRTDIEVHRKTANEFFGKADKLTKYSFLTFIPGFLIVTLFGIWTIFIK